MQNPLTARKRRPHGRVPAEQRYAEAGDEAPGFVRVSVTPEQLGRWSGAMWSVPRSGELSVTVVPSREQPGHLDITVSGPGAVLVAVTARLAEAPRAALESGTAWAIVWEDRRSEPDVIAVWLDRDTAIERAEGLVASIAAEFDELDEDHGIQPLTDAMRERGWAWLFQYGESRVRVLDRPLGDGLRS